ncbi:hypothetical protein PR048_022119 [Dryococelus australis]|uniref:HAT C-terminal dimerisation domain-containing protein n=1 Tax=Dryococelus australis TaxID=614101 RepID=A0ABQ9H041_9NEOP|nr:hypothetical protein PR048_022119 [Dryococelus australis]
MISKLPIKNELLKHAEAAEVNLRKETTFSSVEYLVSYFTEVVNEREMDALELEFSKYHIEELNQEILSSPRMDVCWDKISKLVNVNGSVKYKVLPKIMLAVFPVVPHSNAAAEHIFNENATGFRSNLGTETLNVLIVEKIKMGAYRENCYEKKFPKKQLESAKYATFNKFKLGAARGRG